MKQIIQKSLFALALAAISIAIYSCDYVSPPYSEQIATIATKRKVLLEDFTGHTCPNCPQAAKQADTIERYLFKDQVVVMALHVTHTFADPHPGLFYYDFKTPEGTEIDDFFLTSSVGLPKGMINRTGYPNQTHKKNYTSWTSEVAAQLAKPAEAEITITNTYDQINKIVTTSVKSNFLTSETGKYFLSVFYVEDSIIQAQVLAPPAPVDSFYVFMHVLRGSFNGTWGEQIALDPEENFEVTKQYSTVLKTDAVPKNCRVVAFIYNDVTKEVVQADEKQVQ